MLNYILASSNATKGNAVEGGILFFAIVGIVSVVAIQVIRRIHSKK